MFQLDSFEKREEENNTIINVFKNIVTHTLILKIIFLYLKWICSIIQIKY